MSQGCLNAKWPANEPDNIIPRHPSLFSQVFPISSSGVGCLPLVGVLNHSLDAAHSLDRMSSVWARPTHSINCRVNGVEAHSLDKLPSQWASPYTRHFIERMGHRPVCSTGYWVSGTNAHSPLHWVSGPESHSLKSVSIVWVWALGYHSKDERIRSKALRSWWFV